MKRSQLNRLKKAARKMKNISDNKLSNDQVVNNFEYMLETYELLKKKYEKK